MEDCQTCMGTGYVCIRCDHADGDCICDDDDGPDLERCDDCEPVEVGEDDSDE